MQANHPQDHRPHALPPARPGAVRRSTAAALVLASAFVLAGCPWERNIPNPEAAAERAH